MDPIWIAVAFALGFLMKQIGLPPLIGFLAAGFVLRAFGVSNTEGLQNLADLGITLLLFGIGLKLRVKGLFRPEIWGTASIHMVTTVALFGFAAYGASQAGIWPFSELTPGSFLLVAFALSFSSTVFAVKVLEERGESASMAGRLAIGILIIQDLFAVLFVSISTGKIPSPWALTLLGLPLLRPLLTAIMDRSGHGELLVLLGVLFPTLGAELFEAVGLKPDLGALILGMLLAGHEKSDELSKALLGFKDLFLVGFFLTIGLSESPTFESLGVAVVLALLVPLKVVLFLVLLTRFKVRARASTICCLSLANYSEFGLIVGSVGVAGGWIGAEWLIILALAMSITFVIASPLNSASHAIYARFNERLRKLESEARLPEDRFIDPGDAEIVIFGMGRIGTSTYDELRNRHGDVVLGIDVDPDVVRRQENQGRRVALGDAADFDFWERLRPFTRVRLVVLAMVDHAANLYAARTLSGSEHRCTVAATARHDDQEEELQKLGVDTVFDLYGEAGAGLAKHVSEISDW